MEELRDTSKIWMSLALIFFVISVILGLLLYRSWHMNARGVAESKSEENAAESKVTEASASQEPIRVMDGMVQVYKNGAWEDYCSLDEFAMSDPMEVGNQKMIALVENNQAAVAAGTSEETLNQSFSEVQKINAANIFQNPREEIVWKEPEKTMTRVNTTAKNSGKGKKGTSSQPENENKQNAGTIVNGIAVGSDAASGTTSASTSGTDNPGVSSSSTSSGANNPGASSDSSSSGDSSGGTTPTPPTSGDSGSSTPSTGGGDSGSGGSSSSGSSDSSASGDGEDIGWTDDIL